MPCYNAGLYLAQALKAVSEQTYVNWEVIAIDDCGPKDGTEDIVLAFAQKYGTDRVRFIKHDNNKGVSAARNTGIKNANGAFIALLDPDDFWTPEHLEQAINQFNQDKDLYFYSSFAYLFNGDDTSTIVGIEGYKDWEMSAFPSILSIRNAIPNSSAVLRVAVFERVGLYDENPDIQHVEDYDLWLRILSNNLGIYIHTQPTIYYRKHASAATSNSHRMQKSKLTFANKHKDWLALHQREPLERINRKIYLLENHISSLKNEITYLETRLAILEQTINKFKSLPFLKQFLNLKKKYHKD